MKDHNLNSYKFGEFISELVSINVDLKTDMVDDPADYPSLIHEWCHYIQDLSTISSQNGFYLWMRDLSCMSNITCSTIGTDIHLPIPAGGLGDFVDKYNRLKRVYFGKCEATEIESPKITNVSGIISRDIEHSFEVEHRSLFTICFNNNSSQEYEINPSVLQEINAFYAQRIAESFLPSEQLTGIKSSDLNVYPYKVCDLLCDKYGIVMDDGCKFLFSYLCLDTLQPAAVFIGSIIDMKEKRFSSTSCNNIDELREIVEDNRKKYACDSSVALNEMLKDYECWGNDEGHKCISESLRWYLKKMYEFDKIKKEMSTSKLSMILGNRDFVENMRKLHPIPLYKKNGIITNSTNALKDATYAILFFALKRITELLGSTSVNEINKQCECPFFNFCEEKEKNDTEYTCKREYWSILQGKQRVFCVMGSPLHTLGLWQNRIVIDC